MTQEQRAKALGITVRHLRRLEAQGCPTTLEGARAWRARHLQPRIPRSRSADPDAEQSEYELLSIVAATEDALRELVTTATPDAVRAAILTYVRTLRERAVEEDLIAAMFYSLCSSLGVDPNA